MVLGVTFWQGDEVLGDQCFHVSDVPIVQRFDVLLSLYQPIHEIGFLTPFPPAVTESGLLLLRELRCKHKLSHVNVIFSHGMSREGLLDTPFFIRHAFLSVVHWWAGGIFCTTFGHASRVHKDKQQFLA